MSHGRWRGLLAVAWSGLRSAPGTALVDAAAAALGAAALVLFVGLGLGVGDAARRLFPADDRLVEVVPAPVSLGGLLGGGAARRGRRWRGWPALPGVAGRLAPPEPGGPGGRARSRRRAWSAPGRPG